MRSVRKPAAPLPVSQRIKTHNNCYNILSIPVCGAFRLIMATQPGQYATLTGTRYTGTGGQTRRGHLAFMVLPATNDAAFRRPKIKRFSADLKWVYD